MELLYHKIPGTLDVKYIAGSTKGYPLAPCIYEVIDIIKMLKSLLPKDLKVKLQLMISD